MMQHVNICVLSNLFTYRSHNCCINYYLKLTFLAWWKHTATKDMFSFLLPKGLEENKAFLPRRNVTQTNNNLRSNHLSIIKNKYCQHRGGIILFCSSLKFSTLAGIRPIKIETNLSKQYLAKRKHLLRFQIHNAFEIIHLNQSQQ